MPSSNTPTAHEPVDGPPDGAGALSKLRWAAKHPPQDPAVLFTGKTVLVTGANTGLGVEAAIKFSQLSAEKLILTVRSVAKVEAAKEHILARTGRESDTIDIVTIDLSDWSSVQAFIPALEEKIKHLDIALLNASLGNPSYVQAATGWEMAVSTASSGRQVHLTFTNSNSYDVAEKEWLSDTGSVLETAADKNKWDATKSYSIVKLLNLSVMKAIAQATTAEEIITNAICPGMCKTDLGRNFGFGVEFFMAGFQAIFARTSDQGSRSLVSATALGPESHGLFWNHDIVYPLRGLAKDEELMEKTWSEILKAVEKAQPDSQRILNGRS